MIIETLTNQFYQVRESSDPLLAHCWLGVELKRVKGGFTQKAKAREQLIRKIGTRTIQN